MTRHLRPALLVALVSLVAFLAAMPLWGPGMVNTRGGGDSPFLLLRTQQMAESLRAGVFPVRWMPDAAYGLGYPFFSYYAALPYYLAASLVLLGFDILTALKVTQTLGFVVAALGMFGWMRRMTGDDRAAWLAAAAYTFAPFHLVNVYVRGDSLSEFTAFAIYPLLLWSLDRLREPRRITLDRILPIVLCTAALLLTHNLSAFIFAPFALLYLVALCWRTERRWRTVRDGLVGFALGALLSAWFWLPAIAETGLVQLGPSTEGYFHYSRHFRTLNLVQWQPLFDYAVAASLGDRSPFAMGLAQAFFAVLGMIVLLVRAARQRPPTAPRASPGPPAERLDARWGFIGVGLLLATGMITPLSRPLWDHLPLLPLVQFPWRFLSVQALLAAAVTGALVPRRLPRVALLTAALIAALLALSVLLPLHPERLPVSAADVTVERLQLYELFSGNIGTTIRYEWLYREVVPRPFTSDALVEPDAPPRAIPLDGAALEATLLERQPARQVWRVTGAGGSIAFPLLYWPGWAAQVDGAPVTVQPVTGSGYLALTVPPGEHTVLLWLGRTPVRAVAETTSLLAAVGLLAGLLWRWRRPRPIPLLPILVCSLPVILGLSLMLLLPRSVPADPSDLTMDFEHMPYLHHNPGGVDFGPGGRVCGYTLSAEVLAPGDPLTVTLDWEERGSGTHATLDLVSPAAIRYDVLPLASATCDPHGGSCALVFPPDTPRGLYLLQLRLWGPEGELPALTPQGRTYSTLYLRPVRVVQGPPVPADLTVLAAFGADIRLHAAVVSQPVPDRLAVRLDWSAVRPLAANYAISLRLLDGAGQLRVSLDTQPGYGFLPTGMWRPGELVTDRYLLALPDDLSPGDGYRLQVVLYQAATLEPLGQTVLGEFTLPLTGPFEAQPQPRHFVLPPLEHPSGVEFGDEIRLAGYEVEQSAEALRLTLWWQALRAPRGDYTVFVHLFDPASEAVVAQSDAMPRGGAYPTSWWAEGEVVSETVTLSLADVPPGRYRLAVGLYTWPAPRLPARDAAGVPIPDDRPVLPVEIEVGNGL